MGISETRKMKAPAIPSSGFRSGCSRTKRFMSETPQTMTAVPETVVAQNDGPVRIPSEMCMLLSPFIEKNLGEKRGVASCGKRHKKSPHMPKQHADFSYSKSDN